MPTRKICIRLEEELLALRPSDMGLTAWIREAIKAWQLAKNGEAQEDARGGEEAHRRSREAPQQPTAQGAGEAARGARRTSDEASGDR